MTKIILLLLATLSITSAFSQNSFRAYLKDTETKETLIGATAVVQGTTNGASADINGFIEIKNIPDGKQVVVFRSIGYNQRTDTINFPLIQTEPTEILLASSAKEMEEVVVSATRSSRTIDDIPTRVETIAASELDEKASMQPSNVKMVLTESTGIQTQQTSATSANASIRIQGTQNARIHQGRDINRLTGLQLALIDGLLQRASVDFIEVFWTPLVKAALRQTAMQWHLAAFEAADGDARACRLALATAATLLAKP